MTNMFLTLFTHNTPITFKLFDSFYDISVGSQNCSDSAVFYVLFFYWILELFRQCGIFCFIFLMDLETVHTVWYFLFYFSIGSWNCSDSVVFFVLFFLLDLRSVLTVWYFLFYFSNGSRNCSDGVVFFVLFYLLDLGTVPTVRYFLFYFIYWILELFRQCGIFCFIFLMDLGTVPTVRYILFYFSNGSWICSDSVVFFVLFF